MQAKPLTQAHRQEFDKGSFVNFTGPVYNVYNLIKTVDSTSCV